MRVKTLGPMRYVILAAILMACLELLLVHPARTQTTVGVGAIGDPCLDARIAKSSAFANITTATTTALVAVSGTTKVYVCGISGTIAGTATPSTVLFEDGTGVACAGAPTSLSGTFTNGSGTSTVASVPYSIGTGGATVFTAPAGTGLCAVSTVGTGPSTSVTAIFVQQ